MQVAYQVRVYNIFGQLVAIIDSYRSLLIEHRLNDVPTLTLSMDLSSTAIPHLTLDSLIEVRRRVPEAALEWYTEYIGFHRTPQRQITEGDHRIYTSYSRGLLDLIKRRSIRYYADTNGSAKGPAPADDVIKEYVRENAGTLATVANGRVTEGGTTGLTVAADLNLGPIYEGAHAWTNLLDAIREIGDANSVDFDVVWLNGATFEFKTYYPQRGTDHRVGSSSSLIFSPAFGNMVNPSYTVSRTEEVSSVLVLGPGEGPLRDTTLRTGSNMTDSPWNLIEEDHDARNEDRLAALQAAGDSVLYERRPAAKFAFEVVQTPLATYGKHYVLGDLVTGAFEGVQDDVKIVAATINLSADDEERVTLEFEELP